MHNSSYIYSLWWDVKFIIPFYFKSLITNEIEFVIKQTHKEVTKKLLFHSITDSSLLTSFRVLFVLTEFASSHIRQVNTYLDALSECQLLLEACLIRTSQIKTVISGTCLKKLKTMAVQVEEEHQTVGFLGTNGLETYGYFLWSETSVFFIWYTLYKSSKGYSNRLWKYLLFLFQIDLSP